MTLPDLDFEFDLPRESWRLASCGPSAASFVNISFCGVSTADKDTMIRHQLYAEKPQENVLVTLTETLRPI